LAMNRSIRIRRPGGWRGFKGMAAGTAWAQAGNIALGFGQGGQGFRGYGAGKAPAWAGLGSGDGALIVAATGGAGRRVSHLRSRTPNRLVGRAAIIA
jgi:hypothetical protein